MSSQEKSEPLSTFTMSVRHNSNGEFRLGLDPDVSHIDWGEIYDSLETNFRVLEKQWNDADSLSVSVEPIHPGSCLGERKLTSYEFLAEKVVFPTRHAAWAVVAENIRIELAAPDPNVLSSFDVSIAQAMEDETYEAGGSCSNFSAERADRSTMSRSTQILEVDEHLSWDEP